MIAHSVLILSSSEWRKVVDEMPGVAVFGLSWPGLARSVTAKPGAAICGVGAVEGINSIADKLVMQNIAWR